MYKMNEKELSNKIKEVFDGGFVKDVSLRDFVENGKIVGRELVFCTGISNPKASENKFLIKEVKNTIKKVFGKAPKERIAVFGEVELVLIGGKIEE